MEYNASGFKGFLSTLVKEIQHIANGILFAELHWQITSDKIAFISMT